jgi:hypothetical protein
MKPAPAIHTIYVPPGWSPEQVWDTLRRGEKVVTVAGRGYWVNIDSTGKVVR